MKLFLFAISIPVLLASARSTRGPRLRHGNGGVLRRRLGTDDVTPDIVNGTLADPSRHPPIKLSFQMDIFVADFLSRQILC